MRVIGIRRGLRLAAPLWSLALAAGLALPASHASAASRASQFKLQNGMQVVVIPDHRVPVVTHMVWYRVGAADDPPGRSGLAHFLEHLMFKETARIKSGEFTRIVNRLGGRHNALTSHDTTTYFQRVAKEHLPRVMELEAERMINLRLNEEEVRTERDVVREERRSSIDASPIAIANEQMLAQLYQNHPYQRPVLGWSHEIPALTLADAKAFYARHYAPNNAVLVIAGDVTPEEIRPLAEATYGRNPRNPAIERRLRPSEPEAIAARALRIEDPRAGAGPIVLRYYHVPSLATAKPGDGEALALLAQILGGNDTSRLYRRLVLEARLAVQAGCDYQGGGFDSGRLALLAVAGKDTPAEQIERVFDAILADIRANGVAADELTRAKGVLEAQHVFETDNQEKLARRYGEAVTLGRSLADIEDGLRRTEAVTAADIQRIVVELLLPQRSVTGVLARPRAAGR
jgi:zinc protease